MAEDDLPKIVSRFFKLVAAAIIASIIISTLSLLFLAAGLIYLFTQWV
jgi:hypothetical protein